MAGEQKNGQLKLLLKDDPQTASRIETVIAYQEQVDGLQEQIDEKKQELKVLKEMLGEKRIELRTAIKRIKEPEFVPENA